MSKQIIYIGLIVVFVVGVFLTFTRSTPRTQSGGGARSQAVPYSSASAVRGMISSGTITSVEWGEPNVVTVPPSWFDLRESARESYLFALWDAAGNKADVHVVDESGRVHVYRPSTEPVRDYEPQR